MADAVERRYVDGVGVIFHLLFCNVMLLHMTLRILTTQKFMKSCFREQNMITQCSNHEETNLLKSNFTDEVSLYQEMNGATLTTTMMMIKGIIVSGGTSS